MAEKCSKCGGEVRQRGDSKHTECFACRHGGGAKAVEAPPAGGLKAKRGKNTKKNFKVLCAALGFDADELVGEFMQGWIDRIRDSVKLPGDAVHQGDED